MGGGLEGRGSGTGRRGGRGVCCWGLGPVLGGKDWGPAKHLFES